MKYALLAAIGLLLATPGAVGQTLDGQSIQSDAQTLGMARYAIQDTQTQFGDSQVGDQSSAVGSELNAMWASLDGKTLRLSITGNVEFNLNKLYVFFDAVPGGENPLLGDNIDAETPAIPGLEGQRFSPGFTADHAIRFTHGMGFISVRFVDLIDNTFTTLFFSEMDMASLPLAEIGPMNGVTFGWDNSNTAGVTLGTGMASPINALTADTGWEIEIDLDVAFGQDRDEIGVCAFLTNPNAEFLSNQALPGIGGGGNIAFEDRQLKTVSIQGPVPPGAPCLEKNLVTTSQLDPQSVTLGDLDGDGDEDIAVASSTGITHELAWYENDGQPDAGFIKRPLPIAAFDPKIKTVEIADINGDGNQDIVTAIFDLAGGDRESVIWYENDGQYPAGFTQRTLHPGVPTFDGNPTPIQSLTPVDLDLDGDMDVISCWGDRTQWYRNDGANPPSFTKIGISTNTLAVRHARTGDIDGDGDRDVVVYAGGRGIVIFSNDGSPSSTLTESFVFGGGEDDLALTDLDSDGDLDIFFSLNGPRWLENDGMNPPGFSFQSIPGDPEAVFDLRVEDVDGDGDLDGITLAKTGGLLTYYINDGNPEPTFQGYVIASDLIGAETLDVGNIAGDGTPEVVVGAAGGDRVDWFRREYVINETANTRFNQLADALAAAGSGDRILARPVHFSAECAPVLDLSAFPVTVASAGDIIRPAGTETILGNGSELETLSGTVDIGGELRVGVAAVAEVDASEFRVSGPVDMDLFSTLVSARGIEVRGTAAFTDSFPATFLPLNYYRDIAHGDWDRDGDQDIIGVEPGYYLDDPSINIQPKVVMLRNDGTAEGPFTRIDLFDGLEGVDVGDFTSNGVLELLTIDGGNLVLYWTPDPQTTPYSPIAVGSFPGPYGFTVDIRGVDINKDGLLDIVAKNFFTGQFQWFKNLGGSPPAFASHSVPFSESDVGFYDMADFNGDGNIDLVFSTGLTTLAWAQGSGGETPQFGPVRTLASTSTVISWIDTGDLDDDGALDIVAGTVIAIDDSELRWFRNDGGAIPSVTNTLITATIGDPGRVAAEDLDNDGDLDILVADREDAAMLWFENDGDILFPGFTRRIITTKNPLPEKQLAFDFDNDGDLEILSTAPGGATLGGVFMSVNQQDQEFFLELLSTVESSAGISVINATLETAPVGNVTFFDSGGPLTVDSQSVLLGGGSYIAPLIEVAGELRPIPGDFMQFVGTLELDLETDGVNESGALVIELRETEFVPSVDVEGAATLAGGLFVSAGDIFDPPVGTRYPVLMADTPIGAARFDVAYLPGLRDGKFLRIEYDAAAGGVGGGAGGGTVEIVVDTLDKDIDLTSTSQSPLGGLPAGAALGDITGDGLPDLLLAVPDPADPRGATGSVILLKNAGVIGGVWQGFSGGSTQVAVGINPVAVAVGQIDGVGGPDVLVANNESDTVSILLNDTGDLSQVDFDVSYNRAPVDLELVDLDQNGLLDLAVLGEDLSGAGVITVALNQDPGGPGAGFGGRGGAWAGFADAGDTGIGGRGRSLSCGDLDDDTDEDIAAATDQDQVIIGFNQTGGTGPDWNGLSAGAPLAVGHDPVQIEIRDLSGDGSNEIVTSNNAGMSVSVIVSEGLGSFRPRVDLPVGQRAGSLALSDLDGDGDTDAAVIGTDGNGTNTVLSIRNDSDAGQLSLSDADPLDTPGEPVLLVAGDVDQRNGADLVAVTEEGVSGGASPSGRGGGGASPSGLVVGALLNTLSPGCNEADFAEPFGVLNFNDVITFLTAFSAGDPAADLAGPPGSLDFGDVIVFLSIFAGGCP